MAAFDFPNSPEVGDKYTENGVTFIWDGVVWSSKIAQGVTVSPTEPDDPVEGDLWWDASTNILKVRIGTNWVFTSTFT